MFDGPESCHIKLPSIRGCVRKQETAVSVKNPAGRDEVLNDGMLATDSPGSCEREPDHDFIMEAAVRMRLIANQQHGSWSSIILPDVVGN